MRLRDKVAIVTGAGSGIGRASARLFAQEGARVVVTDIVAEAGQETAELIGGEALLNPRAVAQATAACIVGSLLYRLIVALALNADFLGLQAQDLNLITAVLVAAALLLPRLRSGPSR